MTFFLVRNRNPDGSLIQIDDQRWDPIWKACGDLGLPVLIHTADPVAFFLPIDEKRIRIETVRSKSVLPELLYFRTVR